MMMNAFMDEQFLLSTPTARELYHTYAKPLPILDYHCHINPSEIARDRRYENIAQVWLGGGGYGDHYKWRLMRACGVPERLITGDGDDYEKFLAFAQTLPKAIGNPVYHWAHLELRRYFDCNLTINENTAAEIWRLCNAKLQGELSVRAIITRSNVAGIVTTDDPTDSLEWHAALAKDATFRVPVRPAWRPDKLLGIGKPGFGDYIRALGDITDLDSLRAVVRQRMDHFDAHGCCASDHGLETLQYVPATEAELGGILSKGLEKKPLFPGEILAYQYAMMRFMAAEYARRGWIMEIHYGTIRNINSKCFEALGADTGYDAIAPATAIGGLPALLDSLYREGLLPKTILFSLDPCDNAMLNSICGCFQPEGGRGWVQQGAAWWFNDSKGGMLQQLTTFAELSPLGNFLGMVTDSRSFLSYTRHEYFRRILCSLLGRWVENGEYPDDREQLGQLVQDISYYNTKSFFGF